MKKMMLLAATVALAALMLAAAPAFAQPVTEIDGFRFSPGNCGNLEGTTLTQEQAEALLEARGLDPEDLPDAGNVCLLAQPDGQDGDGQDGDGQDGDGQDGARDGDGFFDFDEPFITQETEQEAESGDIDQSFDVSQTGDNSNQTVGIQGVANTGNAQNVIDVVDAGNFGDFEVSNGNDGFVICDFDNDGENDECEDFNNGFFDDENCFFFDGEFICGNFDNRDFDRDFDVFDNNGTDFEFEDVGATIELSPTQTIDSSQQVNQAAAASATWPLWK